MLQHTFRIVTPSTDMSGTAGEITHLIVVCSVVGMMYPTQKSPPPPVFVLLFTMIPPVALGAPKFDWRSEAVSL
jgi:hypothetical protein